MADATVSGGLSRFINHSCNPNCFTKVFHVNGVARMGIYAKRPIELGEELAYDYKVRDSSCRRTDRLLGLVLFHALRCLISSFCAASVCPRHAAQCLRRGADMHAC